MTILYILIRSALIYCSVKLADFLEFGELRQEKKGVVVEYCIFFYFEFKSFRSKLINLIR
jgi:hypothetical protein